MTPQSAALIPRNKEECFGGAANDAESNVDLKKSD
jgi:hypothetical protein